MPPQNEGDTFPGDLEGGQGDCLWPELVGSGVGSALLLHVPSPTGQLSAWQGGRSRVSLGVNPGPAPARGKCSVLPSSFCLQGKPFSVIFLAPQISGFYGTKP